MKLRDILFENPDWIPPNKIEKDGVGYGKGRPFGYFNDILLLGNVGEMHSDLYVYKEGSKINRHWLERDKLQSIGRIWPEDKIISFWTVDHRIDKIIKDLNNYLKNEKGTTKIDSNWFIDVLSFNLYNKTHAVDQASVLRTVKQVLDEAPNGDCGEYALDWSHANKYYRYND